MWFCPANYNNKLYHVQPTRPFPYQNDIFTGLRLGQTNLTPGHILGRAPETSWPLCGEQITVNHILIECREPTRVLILWSIKLSNLFKYKPAKQILDFF